MSVRRPANFVPGKYLVPKAGITGKYYRRFLRPQNRGERLFCCPGFGEWKSGSAMDSISSCLFWCLLVVLSFSASLSCFEEKDMRLVAYKGGCWLGGHWKGAFLLFRFLGNTSGRMLRIFL